MHAYDTRYPAIADLKERARRRLPKFAWEYLSGGIGPEYGLRRNRDAFNEVQLVPRYLRDVSACDTSVTLFGETYAMPIGVAPVGLAGMLWPQSELILARAASQANIPFTLSTVGTVDLETIAEVSEGKAWFQLYVPADHYVAEDILRRAQRAGYKVLLVTVDVPVGAKRDRELRNGLTLPPRLTPKTFLRAAVRPQWSMRTLSNGLPRFESIKQYAPPDMRNLGGMTAFITELLAQGVTAEHLKMIRDHWTGALVIKGVVSESDAQHACELGADGILVSNHGGRQIDAAPATIQALPGIVEAVGGRCKVLLDSGVRSGTDVLRAMALGADFTLSGRSFYYGVGALGAKGGQQVVEIFREEISHGLAQLGCTKLSALDHRWLGATTDSVNPGSRPTSNTHSQS
jgi:L-lactate dehydrogenase (cytochrome)